MAPVLATITVVVGSVLWTAYRTGEPECDPRFGGVFFPPYAERYASHGKFVMETRQIEERGEGRHIDLEQLASRLDPARSAVRLKPRADGEPGVSLNLSTRSPLDMEKNRVPLPGPFPDSFAIEMTYRLRRKNRVGRFSYMVALLREGFPLPVEDGMPKAWAADPAALGQHTLRIPVCTLREEFLWVGRTPDGKRVYEVVMLRNGTVIGRSWSTDVTTQLRLDLRNADLTVHDIRVVELTEAS
jgi:hypothetical protein